MSFLWMPLPTPHTHIYPMDPDTCHHEVCLTPSTQPTTGEKHYPVFTAEQMEAHARDAILHHLAYLEQGEFE